MSCTKSIVGLAAVCLLEDGHLDSLNTPVYKFYPEWNQGNKKNITVEHLLTMTSGIQNYVNASREIYPSPDFVQLALSAELTDMPGAKFSYNNKAINLMAGIFLKASGKRMDKYISERLLKPLGIENYNWSLDDSGNPHAMSGFQIRPRDFIKLGILLLNEGEYEGKQVITKQNINRIIQPSVQSKEYGLLWWLDYEKSQYIIDEEIINNLKANDKSIELINKMQSLKGIYEDISSLEQKIIEVFGANSRDYINSNFSSPSEIRKKEVFGGIRYYRAHGYLGNFIIIIPEKKLVGVRMISGYSYNKEEELGGVKSFANFKDLLFSLTEK